MFTGSSFISISAPRYFSRLAIMAQAELEAHEALHESASHCAAVGLSGRHDVAGIAALEVLSILEKDSEVLVSLSTSELEDLAEEAGPRNFALACLYRDLAQA